MQGLRSYAFVCVFVAHAGDGKLDEPELQTIRRQVHRAGRELGHPATEIENMLIDTVDQYWRLSERGKDAIIEAFRGHVKTLHERFSGRPEILGAITADLQSIAHADGRVDDMETFLIETVVRLWRTHAT